MNYSFCGIKSLFALLFLLTVSTAYSQTLQFSQVKLISSSTETVPVGKVWKITNMLSNTRLTSAEAAGGGGSAVTATGATQQVVVINGVNIYLASSDTKARYSQYSTGGVTSSASASASTASISPIWLPENTTVAAGSGLQYVSVVEFTVIE